MIDVMLDLETMGKGPRAAIVAIGAVKFHTEVYSRFYQTVDLESSVRLGGEIDASTVLWWLRQSEAARAEVVKGASSLPSALVAFAEWLGGPEGVQVWGNGAAFDNVILASAYGMAGMPVPWRFWNDRCYRTIKSIHPRVPFERAGVHHNAVDDAESQAWHLIQCWAE